ncbi:MAG: PaaI family thioesterase [Solimonas sp.]
MSDAAPGSIPEGFELLPPQYAHSFVAHIGPFHARRESGGGLCIGTYLRAEHCNPFGEAHGGFLAAMADFVCAYHTLRGPDPTPSVTTVQLGTQMIASARLGEWLEGRATIRRKGRTIAHVGCDFTVGDRLVAHAEAVFRVLTQDGVAARLERRERLQAGTTA